MINLYGLRYFYDSCRLGSMTSAAHLNHVSRSAISQGIKKLETDLGVSLLNHKRRGLELTQKGRLLFQRSEHIFAELEKTESLLRQDGGPLQGTLRIGSAQALASFLLQDILARLRRAHPELSIKVQIDTSQELVKKLANREIDLAFFLGDETQASFKQIVVHRGHFKLLRPKCLKEKNTRYALTQSRPETERARALYERRYSSPMPIHAEIASWDAIWSWMTEGLCGGLVPDFLFKRNKAAARNFEIAIDKVWDYEVKVSMHRSRLQDPSLLAFVQALEEGAP